MNFVNIVKTYCIGDQPWSFERINGRDDECFQGVFRDARGGQGARILKGPRKAMQAVHQQRKLPDRRVSLLERCLKSSLSSS